MRWAIVLPLTLVLGALTLPGGRPLPADGSVASGAPVVSAGILEPVVVAEPAEAGALGASPGSPTRLIDEAATAGAKVGCVGTGTDGKRVQLVYARRQNRSDRYAATASMLKADAAEINQIMQASARKTGGNRQVRWVHDSGCNPTVLNITVSNTVTTFTGLLAALKSANLTSSSRKYVVAWDDGDANEPFCGLSQTMPDTTPGPTNTNETQPLGPLVAAAEPNCWTGPLFAHELMHTLGAIQPDSPHASNYGHCTDESDLLCYVDGPGTVVTRPCPASQETLFDCNNDDYFHTNPPTGNYLKTHWNPAGSGWLDPSAPPPIEYLPFGSWASLVGRQYEDILGRPPTTTELSLWMGQLSEVTKTKGELIDFLRRSSENTTNVDPTVRLYRAFLGRAPDRSGLEFWIGRRRAGTWSLTRMADSFASSSEFKTKYGTLTNRQFVTRIYTDVLGRAADTEGVNYWTGKLDRKERSRGGVMVGFSESSEYQRKQAQNTDVSVAYVFLLDRVPTATETADWVRRQLAGTSHVTLIEEILNSKGYATRIGG